MNPFVMMKTLFFGVSFHYSFKSTPRIPLAPYVPYHKRRYLASIVADESVPIVDDSIKSGKRRKTETGYIERRAIVTLPGLEGAKSDAEDVHTPEVSSATPFCGVSVIDRARAVKIGSGPATCQEDPPQGSSHCHKIVDCCSDSDDSFARCSPLLSVGPM